MSVFNSENIITEHISNANLRAYFVGFDFGEYRYDELVDCFLNTLVDFSFGYHDGILKQYNRRILIEAAKSIYKIAVFQKAKEVYIDKNFEYPDDIEDKYLKRGEFGELILHLILRDFINTVPLVSKIHFKDSRGVTVHGFDAVHIGPSIENPQKKSIYFGESKLYQNGETGVKELFKDIEHHFLKDFLNDEFILIGKKREAFKKSEKYADLNTKEAYKQFLEEKEYWFNELDKVANRGSKLQYLFSSVTIPLLCTYTSKVFEKYNDETSDQFKKEYKEEVNKLKKRFDDKLNELQKNYRNSGEPIKSDLNIVLMLFPVPSKKELVKRLHIKLYHQQRA